MTYYFLISKSHREIAEIATYRNNIQKSPLAQTHSKVSLIYPIHPHALTFLIGKGDFLLHSKNMLKPTFSPGCKNKWHGALCRSTSQIRQDQRRSSEGAACDTELGTTCDFMTNQFLHTLFPSVKWNWLDEKSVHVREYAGCIEMMSWIGWVRSIFLLIVVSFFLMFSENGCIFQSLSRIFR